MRPFVALPHGAHGAVLPGASEARARGCRGARPRRFAEPTRPRRSPRRARARQVCKKGYKKQFGGVCEVCSTEGPDWSAIFGLLAAMLLLASPCVYLAYRWRKEKKAKEALVKKEGGDGEDTDSDA